MSINEQFWVTEAGPRRSDCLENQSSVFFRDWAYANELGKAVESSTKARGHGVGGILVDCVVVWILMQR